MAKIAKVATGKGFKLDVPTSFVAMKDEAEKTITRLVANYPKAKKMWELMRDDPEVNADWDMSNYIACLLYTSDAADE